MQDFNAKREHYLAEAAECELIRDLAAEPKKREIFDKLAADLRRMAADLEAVIAAERRELLAHSGSCSREWPPQAGD